MQATETIKLILGLGDPLVGRLLHIDALKMKFREFKLQRDPQCPVCGESPTITKPIDYDAFCSIAAVSDRERIRAISVHELKRKLGQAEPLTILDVREPFEHDIARIEGSRLIPLAQLGSRLDELERDKEIIALCKSGVRSAQAVQLLQSAGFAHSFNLEGGIDAWASEIDPTMERY